MVSCITVHMALLKCTFAQIHERTERNVGVKFLSLQHVLGCLILRWLCEYKHFICAGKKEGRKEGKEELVH